LPEKTDFFWFFFKTSGRVSRAAYFLGQLLLSIIQAYPVYRATLLPQGGQESDIWWFFSAVVILGTLWPMIVIAIKRLHDLGRPGAIVLALFMPVISIIAFIVLCLFPGQAGANRYGRHTNAPAEQ
jgi:uncharacterized membrane protein YhaH (DUF805 family)